MNDEDWRSRPPLSAQRAIQITDRGYEELARMRRRDAERALFGPWPRVSEAYQLEVQA